MISFDRTHVGRALLLSAFVACAVPVQDAVAVQPFLLAPGDMGGRPWREPLGPAAARTVRQVHGEGDISLAATYAVENILRVDSLADVRMGEFECKDKKLSLPGGTMPGRTYRVIVSLKGLEAGPAWAERIAQARERVLAALKDHRVEVIREYDVIPALAVTVDEEGLRILCAHPDVADIAEDLAGSFEPTDNSPDRRGLRPGAPAPGQSRPTTAKPTTPRSIASVSAESPVDSHSHRVMFRIFRVHIACAPARRGTAHAHARRSQCHFSETLLDRPAVCQRHKPASRVVSSGPRFLGAASIQYGWHLLG